MKKRASAKQMTSPEDSRKLCRVKNALERAEKAFVEGRLRTADEWLKDALMWRGEVDEHETQFDDRIEALRRKIEEMAPVNENEFTGPTWEEVVGIEPTKWDEAKVESLLTGGTIRLEKEAYSDVKWNLLVLSVLVDLEGPGALRHRGHRGVDRLRYIVGDNMVKSAIMLNSINIKPNRAFLDILVYKVPNGIDIGGNEMQRRLQSLLFQAIRSGDRGLVETARSELARFREFRTFRGLEE